jgi:hypothetical protein
MGNTRFAVPKNFEVAQDRVDIPSSRTFRTFFHYNAVLRSRTIVKFRNYTTIRKNDFGIIFSSKILSTIPTKRRLTIDSGLSRFSP